MRTPSQSPPAGALGGGRPGSGAPNRSRKRSRARGLGREVEPRQPHSSNPTPNPPSTLIRRSARPRGLASGARHHGYTGARGYHPLLRRRHLRRADALAARGPGQQLPCGYTKPLFCRRMDVRGEEALAALYTPCRISPAGESGTAIMASAPTGTGRRWNWRPIIHAEIENAIRDLKYGVGLNVRGRRLAGGTGDGAQPGPLDSPHVLGQR